MSEMEEGEHLEGDIGQEEAAYEEGDMSPPPID